MDPKDYWAECISIAADECGLASDGGEVPGAGAEQLHLRDVEPGIGDDRTDLQ